jgi:hypothetical protein
VQDAPLGVSGSGTASFAAGDPSVPGTDGFTDIFVSKDGASSTSMWWALQLEDGANETARFQTNAAFADGRLVITAAELGSHTYASIGAKTATMRLYTNATDAAPAFTYTMIAIVRMWLRRYGRAAEQFMP